LRYPTHDTDNILYMINNRHFFTPHALYSEKR
jgi:hypothetical protein